MKKIGLIWSSVFVVAFAASAEDDTRAEFWIDLLMAEPLEEETDLWDDLRGSDVVYLGETHRLNRHHAKQVRILEEMIAGDRPVILGLEQIEARDQETLDRFNAGDIEIEKLAELIEWEKQWRNYRDYLDLVKAANAAGVRVVGLNAPLEVVRQVSQVGVDALEPSSRALLAEKIHVDDPVYERLMNHALSVHASFDPSFLRHVFEAQVSRDDHMAQSIVEALESAKGDQKPLMVVVAGSGHIQFGLGTPDRVRFRLPDLRDRIVLMSESGDLELSPQEEAMRRAVEITHEDIRFIRRPAGDYLYVKEWNHSKKD